VRKAKTVARGAAICTSRWTTSGSAIDASCVGARLLGFLVDHTTDLMPILMLRELQVWRDSRLANWHSAWDNLSSETKPR
jgi:hypothetical protein